MWVGEIWAMYMLDMYLFLYVALYIRWHWIMIMIGYHRCCPFLAAEVS